MKKTVLLCVVILLFAAAALSGCVTREQAQGHGAEETPAPTAEQATPEPTPVPTPTPLPYELAASLDAVDYGVCESDGDVFAAVERLRERAAQPTPEPAAITAASLSEDRLGTIAQNGDLLYILADNDLVIVKAAGEGTEILSRTAIGVSWKGDTDAATGAYKGQEKIPAAVFCDGTRAAVLSERYGYNAGGGTMDYSEYICVDILDVTDPKAPTVTATLGQDGALRNACLTNGQLLLLTEYQIYDDARSEEASSYIPSYYSADLATLVSGEHICADREGTFVGGSVLGLYDLGEHRLTDVRVLLGVRADACLSDGEAVFSSVRRAESFSRDVTTERGAGQETVWAAVTDLFVYRAENGTLAGPTVGAVNGTVPDAACLDLYDGSLRCLSMLDQGRSAAYPGAESVTEETITGAVVTILDEALAPAGRIDALTDGSAIGWAGFAGGRILLTNAEKTASCAAVLSAGTIELTPTTEAAAGRYIRAFGEDAFVLYDQNELGRMTMTLCGLDMKPLADKTFGSDHSSTLENHRAYLADQEADLLTLTADDSYCIYGYSAEKGIRLRADVYLNDWAWNAQGVRVGENLYVVDTKDVRVLSLETLEEVLDLKLQ